MFGIELIQRRVHTRRILAREIVLVSLLSNINRLDIRRLWLRGSNRSVRPISGQPIQSRRKRPGIAQLRDRPKHIDPQLLRRIICAIATAEHLLQVIVCVRVIALDYLREGRLVTRLTAQDEPGFLYSGDADSTTMMLRCRRKQFKEFFCGRKQIAQPMRWGYLMFVNPCWNS